MPLCGLQKTLFPSLEEVNLSAPDELLKAGLQSKTFGDLFVKRILQTQKMIVSGDAVINGNLTVGGTINGTSNSGTSVTATNYSFSYHTGIDPISNSDSYQILVFDNPLAINEGWTFNAPSGAFSNTESGIYAIMWQLTVQRTSTSPSGAYNVTSHLLLNGSEVAGSVIHQLFDAQANTNSKQLVGMVLLDYNANEPLIVEWKADQAIFQLHGSSANSAQIKIFRIS